MYKGQKVAAVVPAYNESRLIGKTITTMPDFVDFIVVINDCSTDDTSERARAVGDPRVVVIDHVKNTGVGGSIMDGHERALALGADINVVMAGDAQMDPAYLPALLDPICDDGYEFTKANRFFSRTSFADMPAVRMLGSVALSFATKVASGYWNLFDPQNGYTAVSRSALLRLNVAAVARGYEFENDLLIWLNIANARAKDVPIPASYGEEVSTMRIHRVAPASPASCSAASGGGCCSSTCSPPSPPSRCSSSPACSSSCSAAAGGSGCWPRRSAHRSPPPAASCSASGRC